MIRNSFAFYKFSYHAKFFPIKGGKGVLKHSFIHKLQLCLIHIKRSNYGRHTIKYGKTCSDRNNKKLKGKKRENIYKQGIVIY